ncbi:MAG: GGDEF domain-containing protein [Candidatus Limnocylindria bacterium]
MDPVEQLFAGANLALALSILALTISTLRTGRRPRHARSWVFFGLASVALVLESTLYAMGMDPLARGMFEFATITLLALGFVFLYGADRDAQNQELQRIREIAERDPMTGLHNFPTFRRLAAEALGRTHEHRGHLALAILDLDGFKAVNDSLGHPAGDNVLQLVATAIRSNLRGYDLSARYGGDEFILLLDRCDADEARRIVQRVKLSVAALTAASGSLVSFSAGIASFPDHGVDVDRLIRSADETLLAVKRTGKNEVRLTLVAN